MGTVRTLPTPTAGVRLADAAKVFLVRLASLRSACGYWRDQGWLTGED